MRCIWTVITFVLLQGNCNNGSKADIISNYNLNGIWVSLDSNGSYSETIYTTNITWTFTEEAGEIKRHFKVEKNFIRKFYIDGSKFLDVEILAFKKDSMITRYNGYNRESKRLQINYNLDKIVGDDQKAKWDYINDYRKRKYDYESKR